MDVSKTDIKNFNKQGFIVVKSKEISKFKDNITSYLSIVIEDIVRIFYFEINLKHLIGKTFFEQINFIVNTEKDQRISRALYELIPSLVQIISVVDNDLITNIAKSFGVQKPVAGTLPLIRIDRPYDEHFNTPMHQDYWFSMLSENAIVMWMPLVSITSEMGLIEVIPESHKNGLAPFRENDGREPFTTIDDYSKDTNKISVKVGYDEILLFNQYLLHQSGRNCSNKTRVTMQLRFNDLETIEKPTSSYIAEHSTYVKDRHIACLKQK